MFNKEKTAILVVDILNDFVTGSIQFETGKTVIEPTNKLLKAARTNNIPVIFCNDSHRKGVDHEFKLWGEHACLNSEGGKIVSEIEVSEKDYIVHKRRYSGFFQTDLDLLLRELNIENVIMTGLYAHLCVTHTAADAYQNGYNVIVALECTNGFTKELYDKGIDYMKSCYGAQVYKVDELIQYFNN